MFRVFVVDDEEIVRNGIRALLDKQDSRFTVCGEASDGELAIPMIQELKPDILLTDINMPFVDGLELCEVVRRRFPWIHLLIFSGYDEFEYAKKAISLQVDEYILKPLTREQLMEALQKSAERIEKERRSYFLDAAAQTSADVRKTDILEKLINGLLDERYKTSEVLSLAEQAGVVLTAEQYLICCLELRNQEGAADVAVRRQMSLLLARVLNERSEILWTSRDYRHLLLIKGTKKDNILETAYESAQVLRHEVSRLLNTELYVGIWPAVVRLTELHRSYREARDLLSRYHGMPNSFILSASDQPALPEETIDMKQTKSISVRLRHIKEEDIDELLEQHFGAAKSNSAESMLYRYYLLSDLIVSGSELARDAGLNLSGTDIFMTDVQGIMKNAGSYETALVCAKKLITEFIELRDSSDKGTYNSVIRDAKAYIQEHFAEREISLNSVAGHVGFSPSHFSTVFAQQTGQTFIEYLTDVRIRQAKQMLKETDKRLFDISYEVGYNESHYFSFIFKKETGMSPGAWRKANKDPEDTAG